MINYTNLTWEQLLRKVGNWFDHPKAILEALKRLHNNSNALPYKTYIALLNQTGTNAPVPTVLMNTTGGIITWEYSSDGEYFIKSDGLFAGNVGGFVQDTNLSFARLRKIDNNTIYLSMFNATPEISDGLLNDAMIELKIFN